MPLKGSDGYLVGWGGLLLRRIVWSYALREPSIDRFNLPSGPTRNDQTFQAISGLPIHRQSRKVGPKITVNEN
jgi:hypothetical protein